MLVSVHSVSFTLMVLLVITLSSCWKNRVLNFWLNSWDSAESNVFSCFG